MRKNVLIIIASLILIGIILSFAVAETLGLLPIIKGVTIKETNLRYKVDINGIERSYPLDIITQPRYDSFGRLIANDRNKLEKYILIDKYKIENPKNKTEVIPDAIS